MSYVDNEAQFRFPIALQILFAIITLLGVIALPESPRWVSFAVPRGSGTWELTQESLFPTANATKRNTLSGLFSLTQTKFLSLTPSSPRR